MKRWARARAADSRADLDLRAQELGAHLAAQGLLAFGEQSRRRLRREIASLFVDEEILFLDADAETWFGNGHGVISGMNIKGELMPPR